MFTGLVEEVGIIKAIKPFYDGLQITVHSRSIIDSLKIGDSVAVDGVCQTIVNRTADRFTVEAVGETLAKTTFRYFTLGRKVNLERAMISGERFDGHFIQGHINGTGKIIRRMNRGNHFFLEIDIPTGLCSFIIEEGSISIDGVSLTISSIEICKIGINLIPHTVQNCTLGDRKAGDMVNIETDLLGRYAARQLRSEKKTLNEDTLKKWGY